MKTLALLTLFAFCTLLSAQTELQTMLVFESPTDGTCYDFGKNISGNGDMNGDGYNDIVIPGHPIGEDEDERRIYIYFGSAQPDSIPDIVLDVPTVETGDMNTFGRVIAYDGDLNGDGYDELVVASPEYDYFCPNAGMVFIYWGGETLSEEPDVILNALDYGDDCWGLEFGSDIDTSGDLNDDGYDDLVIGSPGPSLYWNGQVDVFFGGDPFDMNADWHVQGEIGEQFGDNVAVGDINGDGYDDLAVSQYVLNSSDMQFRVFSGDETISTIPNYVGDDIFSTNISQLFMNGDPSGDQLNDLAMVNVSAIGTLDIMLGDEEFNTDLLSYQLPLEALYPVHCFYTQLDSTFMIAVSSMLDSTLVLLEYTGADSLIAQFIRSYQWNGHASAAFFIGDYNGDGYGDILQTSYEGSETRKACILTTNIVSTLDDSLPPSSACLSSFPNPAHGDVNISFSLLQQGRADITVYNVKGQRVRDLSSEQLFTSGQHTLHWDGNDSTGASCAAGIYFIRITHASGVTTGKLVLLK